MPKAKIVIAYHSGYGHTAKQAEAVARGAASAPGAEVALLSVGGEGTDWDLLDAADAIIFGAPTYMGGPSAQFKTFVDATSKRSLPAGGRWKDKIAAGFTNSASQSGDKLATLQQIAIYAAQMGMHWVSLGLPPGNNSSKASINDLNRLGIWLGAGAQSNADEGADVAPPHADLLTAEHLGRRVAEATLQFVRGRRATETAAFAAE